VYVGGREEGGEGGGVGVVKEARGEDGGWKGSG